MKTETIREAGMKLATSSVASGIEYALRVFREELSKADFIEDGLGRAETKCEEMLKKLRD